MTDAAPSNANTLENFWSTADQKGAKALAEGDAARAQHFLRRQTGEALHTTRPVTSAPHQPSSVNSIRPMRCTTEVTRLRYPGLSGRYRQL